MRKILTKKLIGVLMLATLIVLLMGLGAARATEADFVLDWEGVSAGAVAPAQMAPAVKGTVGAWTAGTFTRFAIEARTNSLTFPTAVTVGSATYTGAGTNWLKNDMSSGSAEFLELSLGGQKSNVVVAGFIKTSDSFDWDSHDVILMDGYGGVGWASLNLEQGFRAHSQTNADVSTYGAKLTVTDNKIYFFTMARMARLGWVTLRLYDPSNGFALVGESAAGLRDSAAITLEFWGGYVGNIADCSVYYGPMFGIYDPTDEELSALAISPASLDAASVQARINAASVGEVVGLAAGSATWTNSVWLTNGAILCGTNVWITNGIGATDPLIYVQNSRVAGMGMAGTNSGYGIRTVADANTRNGTRIDHCTFTAFTHAIFQEGWGLVDHCDFINNVGAACRSWGSFTADAKVVWTNYYPIAWNSTNFSFYEDCNFTNSRAGGYVFLEGDNGGAYVVRHCVFSASGEGEPQGFDAHGDGGLGESDSEGVLAVQWYSNAFYVSDSAYMLVLADLRGGRALIYSNSVAGNPAWAPAAIQYRVQQMGNPDHYVRQSYVWDNFKAGSSTPLPLAIGVDAELTAANITVGVDIITNAPAELVAPVYPHPLVSAQDGTPEPEPPSPATGGTATVTTMNVGRLIMR